MDSRNEKSTSKAASAVSSGAMSVIRSMTASSIWLRKSIWVWPIVAGLMLAVVGWFLRSAVESRLKEDRASSLETILNADVEALRLWMRSQETAATAVASDPETIAICEKVVALSEQPGVTQLELFQSPLLKELRDVLAPELKAHDYSGFILVDPSLRIAASLRNELVGAELNAEDKWYVTERAFKGKPTVSVPRKSAALLPAKNGQLKAGVPTMLAWAPIFAADGKVVAALGLRIRPEDEFSEILHIARAGKTGETYAFNRDAVMVSESRFDDDLSRIGLLPEGEDSVTNIQLRDPGVDMMQDGRPDKRRSEQPLTRNAAAGTEGKSGVDIDGYRDYRGVWTVGAWTWLDDYDLGVATEQDEAEAFAVLRLLRAVFWGLFGLLVLAAAAIFVFTVIVARINREVRLAVIELRQLGQYTLDEKLGEGGMGVVYRAHHAMLHRPTAVKFLNAEKTNEQSVARFEREVQLTSQLTHPNTISIYDYGRTPEGIFYYAMEYLQGIDLEGLVRKFGPLPEGRVIHILEQVCGSLAEAHAIGLVHRDIKPANIILSVRGGLFDFAKLLDFGLVKALDQRKESQLTTMGSMAGTPLYLSPEAIENPDDLDARSDLYAVGAVGYYLLTGTPVFDGRHVMEILQKHVTTAPEPPSQRLGRPVSEELEQLLLKCLAKNPADRPSSAGALADELTQCPAAVTWTKKDAQEWWTTQFRGPGDTTLAAPTAGNFEQTAMLTKTAQAHDTTT